MHENIINFLSNLDLVQSILPWLSYDDSLQYFWKEN
jgi:hypothetical protein